MQQFLSLTLKTSLFSLAVTSQSNVRIYDSESNDQCRFYMAPSTTDPKSFGYFTSVDVPANFPLGPPDIAIQFLDFRRDSETREYFDSELFWTSALTGGKFELPPDLNNELSIITAMPGLGMIGAFHPLIVNAKWDHEATIRRRSDGRPNGRVNGPGAGAYSYYHNVTAIASRNIWAGEEIFIDFGDEWESHHEEEKNETEKENSKNTDKKPVVSTRKDYEEADKKVSEAIHYFDKYRNEFDETPKMKREIWLYLLTTFEERVRQLLPKQVDELEKVYEMGSILYKHRKKIHPPQWISKNGRCMDNLRAAPSTIPHAGRGAFATRSITHGEVIVTSPVSYIFNKTILEIKTSDESWVGNIGADSEVKSKNYQVFMNYCFRHPNSTILIFPFGSMINYINHYPENMDEPNAKIVWAHQFTLFNVDILEMSIEALKAEENPLLFLDVVATRDLKEGEEIFIDYGEEWLEAWNAHASSWSDPFEENYVSHFYMNEQAQNDTEFLFRTVEEQTLDPYPDNIETACYLSENLLEELMELDDHRNDEMSPFLFGAQYWAEWTSAHETYEGDYLRSCKLIKRTVSMTTTTKGGYDVDTTSQDVMVYQVVAFFSDEKPIYVDGVPHREILFMEKAGWGDVYLPNTFRHFIGGIEHLFPPQWLDL